MEINNFNSISTYILNSKIFHYFMGIYHTFRVPCLNLFQLAYQSTIFMLVMKVNL